MYRVITNTPSKMPKIVKITVSEVSSTGYRVTAQIEASRGISKVLMPTWTEANGQDDFSFGIRQVFHRILQHVISVRQIIKMSMEPILHMFMYMMRMEILHLKERMCHLTRIHKMAIQVCFFVMENGSIIRMER